VRRDGRLKEQERILMVVKAVFSNMCAVDEQSRRVVCVCVCEREKESFVCVCEVCARKQEGIQSKQENQRTDVCVCVWGGVCV
jgi:hypothetical protein